MCGHHHGNPWVVSKIPDLTPSIFTSEKPIEITFSPKITEPRGVLGHFYDGNIKVGVPGPDLKGHQCPNFQVTKVSIMEN